MARKRTAAVLLLALVAGLNSAAAVELRRPPARAAVVEPTTYVANANANTITEYPAGADRDATPVRSIAGPDTALAGPVAVALDATGTLYVANSSSASITEYPARADRNTRPIRTIPMTGEPTGIAVDRAQNLYVTTYGLLPAGNAPYAPSQSVVEYASGAKDRDPPVRTISGPDSGLDHPVGIAVDRAQHVYVLNRGDSSGTYSSDNGSITEYGPDPVRNAPIRRIAGPSTGISDPRGLAVDAAGTLYVANYTGTITEYGRAVRDNAPPTRTLTVDRPISIALDGRGTLHVGNVGNVDRPPPRGPGGSVTEYAAGAANGDPPLRIIIGLNTGIDGPYGIAVVDPPTPPPPPPSPSLSAPPLPARPPPPSPSPTPAPPVALLPLIPAVPRSAPPVPRPAHPSTRSPLLLVSPTTGHPSQVVTARGAGYPPHAEITIVFARPGAATPPGPSGRRASRIAAEPAMRVSTASSSVAGGTAPEMTSPPFLTSAAGDFTVSFSVPPLPPGDYAVEARAQCCPDQRAPFTLVETPPVTGGASGVSQLTQLSQSIPTPRQVARELSRDMSTVVHGLALGAFMVFVIGFPAELFNKTLEENYDEVRGWFRRLGGLRRRVSRVRIPTRARQVVSRPGVRFAAFCVVAAALTALVDPDVLHYCQGGDVVCNGSWWTKTAQVFIGFLVAIPVTTLVFAVPEETVSRVASGKASRLSVLPLALAAAAVFAAFSAVGQFLPGYVYGLVAGYAALRERELREHDEGVAVLFGGAAVLGMSLVMWLTWGPIREAVERPGTGFVMLTLNAALSQLVILGVQAVVFGLMPFRFLAGAKLRRWSWMAWLAVYGAAAFLYAFVLVISTKETLGKSRATNNEVEVIGLFIGFGVLSIAFWGYFWLRERMTGAVGRGPSRADSGPPETPGRDVPHSW